MSAVDQRSGDVVRFCRAAKSASHGGLVPLRHATRCHAACRQRVAERADADRRPGRASPRGDCAAAVACDRRAASACRGTPSASARCPAHTAAAADAASGGPCCCRRIRHRRRPRSASRRPPACGAPASAPAATSPERRPRRECAPLARRAGSLVHASGRYSKAPIGHARWPVHSAAVTATWQFATLPKRAAVLPRRRRPNAAPTWGSSFRRGSECPCAPAVTRPQPPPHAPRPPTAHA